ncbi:MAG TPA: nucleotidyltransferase domain-containing protein [Ardenticatenaceae bacterium]|nr:nucleotidyltransferase domain-containing protein [Ardenticatenaceae bacterium]
MNDTSRSGLDIARCIMPVYSDNPKVKLVMVGGSVSRGCADDYSDLEIGVFWSTAPLPDERTSAIERLGGELWTFDRAAGNEHYGLKELVIDGNVYQGTAMISTQHMTVAEVDACLSAVLDRYDTSMSKQVLLSAIQHAIPLYGAPLLHEWQTRVAHYPDELAIKMVQENLWFGPWFWPEAYSARDDILVLYQHFIWAEQCILKVLAGLNRVYYPSSEHKWMDQFIAGLQVAPRNCSSRMKQVFGKVPLEGWSQLKELLYETVALVEEHLPDVNTRSLFEGHPEVNTVWARKRWETYPPYTLMRNMSEFPAPEVG